MKGRDVALVVSGIGGAIGAFWLAFVATAAPVIAWVAVTVAALVAFVLLAMEET